MLVLLTDDHFKEFEARRHEWGADKLDELWSGVHHLPPVGRHSTLQQAIALLLLPEAREHDLVPALGAYEPREPDAHRISDASRPRVRGDQTSTAALAVEIVNRGDDLQRLHAFSADRVGGLVTVDLERRTVDWFALVDGDYGQIAISRLINVGSARLAEMIESPAPGEE